MPYETIKVPTFRKLVIDAARLAKKKSSIYGLVEFDITEVMKKIRRYRIEAKAPLSLTAYVISCIGQAVEANSEVQGYLKGSKLICYKDVDLCLPIEMKIKDAYFPVIHILRSINSKSCTDIEQEIRTVKEAGVNNPEFQQRWKSLKWFLKLPFFLRRLFYHTIAVSPHRFKKHMGTVALTAVGMFGAGSGWGIPLLNHSLEVVMGGTLQRPVLKGGKLENREWLAITISIDHAVVDGAPGARFTKDLRERVEKGTELDQLLESG